MTPVSIVNWFAAAFRAIGLDGCSSHSGRRSFITRAARLVHRAGGSLRDVQILAGHRSIQTTQRYIDGDSDAQRKLVSLISLGPPRWTEKNTVTTGIAYAYNLVHEICCLAGPPSFLDDLRREIGRSGVRRAVKDRDTPALFDWLIEILSFQGISNSVASGFIARNGSVRWADIAETLATPPSCSKLHGYWLFDECKYRKAAETCAQPSEIDDCPLPRHPLRNGRLNQMAYSLFLFMRDVARNDFVGWIDLQLGQPKIKRYLMLPGSMKQSLARCETFTGCPTRFWRWPSHR